MQTDTRPQEQSALVVPLDIALSLLRPDELEKLKRYVLAYLKKYYPPSKEQKETPLD